jgi:uncharacterized protein
MFVDLTQLEKDELRVEHQYSPEQFDLSDDEIKLITQPRIDFHLRRIGREIRIRGRLTAEVEAVCDRCLNSFTLTLAVPLDVFYAPIERLKPEEEVELSGPDLTLGFYRDEMIDVDALVREQIRLALPFRMLCREDCRGLCQTCGADLNRNPCACSAEEADPRWAVLLEFKKRSE